MYLIVGLAVLAGSTLLMRVAKRFQLAGNRFWVYAAASTWLPVLFTGMFGLGVICLIAGAMQLAGA